jgi:hypothetical protein
VEENQEDIRVETLAEELPIVVGRGCEGLVGIGAQEWS